MTYLLKLPPSQGYNEILTNQKPQNELDIYSQKYDKYTQSSRATAGTPVILQPVKQSFHTR